MYKRNVNSANNVNNGDLGLNPVIEGKEQVLPSEDEFASSLAGRGQYIEMPLKGGFSDLQSGLFLAQDNEHNLLVLQDMADGLNYYMDIIDNFVFEGNTYTVMTPFSDKLAAKKNDELIIMRMVADSSSPLGYRYTSLHDSELFDRVFDFFFLRYEQATIGE